MMFSIKSITCRWALTSYANSGCEPINADNKRNDFKTPYCLVLQLAWPSWTLRRRNPISYAWFLIVMLMHGLTFWLKLLITFLDNTVLQISKPNKRHSSWRFPRAKLGWYYIIGLKLSHMFHYKDYKHFICHFHFICKCSQRIPISSYRVLSRFQIYNSFSVPWFILKT